MREAFQGWLQDVKRSPRWEELQEVRHHLLHRWIRVDVTVGAVAAQQLVINGNPYSATEFDATRAFVVDRFVAAGLLLLKRARARAGRHTVPYFESVGSTLRGSPSGRPMAA